MSMTAAQRITALQIVAQAALYGAPTSVPNGTPLASVLPGVTAAEVWSAIATALGTTVDTQLTTVLGNAAAIVQLRQTGAADQATELATAVTDLTVV